MTSRDDILSVIYENAVQGCLSWSSWEKLHCETFESFSYFFSPINSPLFHSLLQSDPEVTPTAELFAHIHALQSEHGIPFAWITPRLDSEQTLASYSDTFQFQKMNSTTAMALCLKEQQREEAPLSQGSIAEVTGSKDLREWAKLLLTTYGFDDELQKPWFQMHQHIGYGPETPWRHFLVREGKKAIGTGSLFCGPRASSIANISLIPSQQGKGYGTALLSHLENLSEELGYEWITLFSSPEAEELYRKVGFEEYGATDIYLVSG